MKIDAILDMYRNFFACFCGTAALGGEFSRGPQAQACAKRRVKLAIFW
jgi:hypothetical protein